MILQNLQGRDGVSLTIEAITEFQNAELAYSEDIASRLSIPFQIGNSNHVERFIDFIQSDPSNYGST